jgi:hypothetical protein
MPGQAGMYEKLCSDCLTISDGIDNYTINWTIKDYMFKGTIKTRISIDLATIKKELSQILQLDSVYLDTKQETFKSHSDTYHHITITVDQYNLATHSKLMKSLDKKPGLFSCLASLCKSKSASAEKKPATHEYKALKD